MKKLTSLLLSAVLLVSMLACGASAKTNTKVRIAGLKGPTTMGLVNLLSMEKEGTASLDYDLQLYGAADEIVPKLIKGDLDMAAIPANLAATLYQKTNGGIQVMAVNTLGVLYVVEKGDTVHSFADLKGRTILSTGKGTTPEYVLRYLLRKNGLDPDRDVKIEYYSEASEVTDGETTAGYFPNGKISDIDLSDLYAIIGSNDITVVDNPTATPYCSTVCLQITTNNGGTNYGSGFMIGPNALATAAHNLYSIKEKAYVKSVNVAPARSDNSKPFGSENVSASSMIVSDSYLAGTSSEDWAIITLKNNLGTKTGWLGLHWQSSNYSSSQLVYAYGYPSQINGADARYRMCKSSGYIRSQTSKYLKGDWDLTGGFSGGPLVEYISGAGYVAIGIHKDGSTIDGSSYPTSYTGALRITQSLYTLFLSYRG